MSHLSRALLVDDRDSFGHGARCLLRFNADIKVAANGASDLRLAKEL